MNSSYYNMAAGSFLGTVFVVMSVSLVSEALFHTEAPETPGYAIEVAEAAPAEGGEDGGTPIATLLASADPAAGETSFRKCASCHTAEEGGANGVGPNLWGVVNRPIASHEGFSYSAAMTEFSQGGEVVWDYEHLAGFLASPRSYIPGTAMSFAGLTREDELANVIAYLRTLAAEPVPLPEPEAAPAEGEAEAAPAEGAEGEAAPAEEAAATGEAPAEGAAAPAEEATPAAESEEAAAAPAEEAPAEEAPAPAATAPDEAAPAGEGNAETTGVTDNAAPVTEEEAPADTQAPAEEVTPAEDAAQAPAEENAATTADEAVPTEEEAAPEEGAAATEGAAPAAGEEAAATQGAAAGPAVALLAEADAANGESIFRRCVACHSIDEGGQNRVGPNLWGVVGRPVASVEGFGYSDAMVAYSEGGAAVWDFGRLDTFLAAPRDVVEGTTMAFPGLPDDADRADLLAYLREQSGEPVPLPAE